MDRSESIGTNRPLDEVVVRTVASRCSWCGGGSRARRCGRHDLRQGPRIRHGIGDGSDIGRIKRQQAFLAGLIKKVKGQGMNPVTLLPLAKAAAAAITVDPGLGSADKLLSFALGLKDIDLHDTAFVTRPWRYQGARVAIVHPDAERLWAMLKADRTLDGTDAGGKARPTARSTATPTPSAGAGTTSALGDDRAKPAPTPTFKAEARSADDDPCSNPSFG